MRIFEIVEKGGSSGPRLSVATVREPLSHALLSEEIVHHRYHCFARSEPDAHDAVGPGYPHEIIHQTEEHAVI